MGGLAVKYSTAWNQYEETPIPASWQVVLDGLPIVNNVLLFGFARKQDAVIAVTVMRTLPLDWDAPEEELRRQWRAYGGRDEVMKEVCQHLQW